MNRVALAAGLAVLAGNLALYGANRLRLRRRRAAEPRASYEMSWPTRAFRRGQLLLYGGAAGHVVHEAFRGNPAGPSPVALAAGLVLGVAGLALLEASFRALGSNFAPCHAGLLPVERVRRGPYRFVSHPIYVSNLLQIASLAVLFPGPIIAGVGALAAFFIAFAIRDEERALRARFGAAREDHN